MEEFYEQMPLLKSTEIGNGASIFREKTPLGDCPPRLRIESATDDKKNYTSPGIKLVFQRS